MWPFLERPRKGEEGFLMGSFTDPHLEAMMETEARYPQHGEQPPPDFRRKQMWGALILVCIVVLVIAAVLFLR
jgi:hypothetical protein